MLNALKAVTAAGGATPPPTGLPTLALSTTRLDFGTVQTQLQITLTRINGSTDSPASAVDSAANPDAVTLTAVAGPADGPYVLNVNVDRALLNAGENQVQVEITSAQGRKLRFDVAVAPRGGTAPTGLRGVGPVYVLALNPDTLATLAQANVINNATTYPYSLANLMDRAIIVAGTDTDNDGFICSASEPCGAYPVLGVEATILDAGRNNVNFDLIAGGSAASLAVGAARTLVPAHGFARLR
jgi:serine protease